MVNDEHYQEWCLRIAESREFEDLISHFREHVGEHYERHNREGQLSLDVWIIGVLNFMHIFEKKFPHLTTDDLLYKLCRYHVNHRGGPDAPFNVEDFLKEYNGPLKDFHLKREGI
jgi:hypothetical protein